MTNKEAPLIFWILPVIMILIANLKMPYGYYSLMKVIVSASCLLGTIEEYKRGAVKSQAWFIITVSFAILYNPLIKISLGRNLWIIVNILTIVLFIMHYLHFKKLKVRTLYDKIF